MDAASNVVLGTPVAEGVRTPSLFNIKSVVVYGVLLLLLFVVQRLVRVARLRSRPVRLDVFLVLFAVPIYAVYYEDEIRRLIPQFRTRSLTEPYFARHPMTSHYDPDFASSIAPAIMAGILLLLHLVVLQRGKARTHLERIVNLISPFFAFSLILALAASTVLSTVGWQRTLRIAVTLAFIYLLGLPVLASTIETASILARLGWSRAKRDVFTIATFVTRAAVAIVTLRYWRIHDGGLTERIWIAAAAQREALLRERDDQDRRRILALIQRKERKRRSLLKSIEAKFGGSAGESVPPPDFYTLFKEWKGHRHPQPRPTEGSDPMQDPAVDRQQEA